jgi:putative flippase GtrA
MTKLVGYLVTGGAAAAVDLAGFHILLKIGAPIGLAATGSWLAAALLNYGLSSKYVFKRRANWLNALLFLLGAAFGLSINVAITVGLTLKCGADPLSSKVIGIAVAFFCNFFINLFWVFK